MEITTLKDIKDCLKDIPDELLDNLSFGTGEGCEDLVSIIAPEGSEVYDFPQVFDLINKKYPQINDFNKLINNIGRAQSKLDNSDGDDDYIEGISSDDKI